MKVLGITGGVGAGKTTVMEYMKKTWGARVIQADQVGHLLMEPGGRCYGEIVRSFGHEILREDETIDRRLLGSLVFGDPQRLEKLNSLVHPAVKEWICLEIEKERKNGKVPFVVVEAALLLEDHYEEICDEIWYVHTDEEVRIRRLMENRGYSREQAERIMENQLSEEVFRRQCQFVVDNSEYIMENTYEQIDRGLKENEFL